MLEYDINDKRGDTWHRRFRLQESNADGTPGAYLNLTGYTFRSQIRSEYGNKLATLEASVYGDPIDGYVDAILTAEESQRAGQGIINDEDPVGGWDLELISAGGAVSTAVTGKVYLKVDYSYE